MIIIADSGSTKCDWIALDNGKEINRHSCAGINPFFQSQEEIIEQINQNVLEYLPDNPDAIYFYGAGCTPEKSPLLEQTLSKLWADSPKIEVKSDLIAAARSLCGGEKGIACILGTGSNSCEWNGSEIVKQVSPCGFILGDEGSGAVMGKIFVGELLKSRLPKHIIDSFMEEYALTPAQIIENVYRNPYPNRFLASTVHFIYKNMDQPQLASIVEECLDSFFERCVTQYDISLPVSVTGSTGFYFKDIFMAKAQKHNLKVSKISKAPMEGLIEYHNNIEQK